MEAVLYSDAACPWAYSAMPALRVLEWRYGDQLDWRLVLVGLADDASRYEQRGYTPLRVVQGRSIFRRYGMPFSLEPRPRVGATGRGCRAAVAARLIAPGSEWRVFRALQLANFTTALMLDEDDGIAQALRGVDGVDADAIVARLEDPEVTEAYERDKRETRSAEGSAAELQGKTATTDGPVRFTAPSLVLERDGVRLVGGGFQSVDAYDVLVANLDPTLERAPAPDTPEPLLDRFPDGLATQEVAALKVRGNEPADRGAAELALLELVAAGRAKRTPVGDDAVWHSATQG